MATIDLRSKLKPKTIFEDLTQELDRYKEKEVNSVTFLAESSTDGRVKILLKYPGRKVQNRKLQLIRSNSVHWDYLYDFLVIPVFNGKELEKQNLTYRKILKDYEDHKRKSSKFWKAILEVLNKNTVSSETFKELKGIDSKLFLYVLKWLWIQEDLNYRINHNDFKTPTRYRLPKGKSLGRKKFFAALYLVHEGVFTASECSKLFS